MANEPTAATCQAERALCHRDPAPSSRHRGDVQGEEEGAAVEGSGTGVNSYSIPSVKYEAEI